MCVAGYGPSALAVAGRVGDGVIIQLADPDIIGWMMATAGARRRRRGATRRLSSAWSARLRRSRATSRTRGGGSLVPGDGREPRRGHDQRYGRRLGRCRGRSRTTSPRGKFYDYDDHSRVGGQHGSFVSDEICDRFCVLGIRRAGDGEAHGLESIGVDQLIVYLMTEGQDETLAAYGSGSSRGSPRLPRRRQRPMSAGAGSLSRPSSSVVRMA